MPFVERLDAACGEVEHGLGIKAGFGSGPCGDVAL
jgi:hypothetical protein